MTTNTNIDSEFCDDCHGFTHMPWCPNYEEPVMEKGFTATEAEALLEPVITRARADLNDGKPLVEVADNDDGGLESQKFYELMQAYRHAPLLPISTVADAYEAVKTFLRSAETRHTHDYQSVKGQSVPQCACGAVHNYSCELRQEHSPLRSLREAALAMLREPFEERWERAPVVMKDDMESAEYWFQQGRQSVIHEQVEIANEDLREMRRLVKEKIE
jgi:hypothetical protein